MSKFIWVKIENARAVELEVTDIRNVNALIVHLKNRFELATPAHFLVLNQHGMEIPADSLLEKIVSSFKQPLELLCIDSNPQPAVPRYTSINQSRTNTPNEFRFLETPPFLGNPQESANRDYFKVPAKPFLVFILLLGSITAFNQMFLLSPIYGLVFLLDLLGFWATLQKIALYLSYYAWGRLLLLIPETGYDIINMLLLTSKNPTDEIALFGIALIIKYTGYGFYFFCIRKVWSKLNTPAVRLDVEEPLIAS